MAQIDVSVAGKDYTLACAVGDENRLADLAAYVNEKASSLKGKLGHVSEGKLLLMVAILIADELKDHLEEIGEPHQLSGYSASELASIIDATAVEIESIAEKLNKA